MPMQNPLLNAPAAPQGGMVPQGQPMPPQPIQGAPAGPPPSPEEVAEGRKHLGAIMGALSKVAAKPQGQLDKQDVFEAAADMLQNGGFPTPESRASLIGTLAQMPNDEQGIRAAVGRMMLRVAQVRDAFHAVHGTGQPPAQPMAQPPAGGTPVA